MDKILKEKADRLVKSMYKRVKQAQEKDAMSDLMDPDSEAEMSPDEVSGHKSNILNKNKEAKSPSKKDLEYPTKEDVKRAKEQKIPDTNKPKGPERREMVRRKTDLKHPTDVKDPKYPSKKDLEYPSFKKTEDFVKSVIDGFEKISKAYFMEKARFDKEKFPEGSKDFASKRRAARKERGPAKPHTRDKAFDSDETFEHKGKTHAKKITQAKIPTETQEGLKQRLKDKQSKKPKFPGKEDLEYPMAASEDKPFHGYNKEKHSKEGGLSAKAREKYNREEGANLKAPVSSKEAKKSPKKAGRRKSFCARMSGVKGATSKKGKLTPKGAALKRWDC